MFNDILANIEKYKEYLKNEAEDWRKQQEQWMQEKLRIEEATRIKIRNILANFLRDPETRPGHITWLQSNYSGLEIPAFPGDTPDDSTEGSPDDTPDDSTDNTPDDSTESSPDDTPDDSTESSPDDTPDDSTDNTPDDFIEGSPDDTPDDSTEGSPDNTPNDTSDDASDDTSDETDSENELSPFKGA